MRVERTYINVYKDVNFGPTSVQFKRVIARPFGCKRHQMQHLFDFYCLLCKRGVRGSNPLTSTIFCADCKALTKFTSASIPCFSWTVDELCKIAADLGQGAQSSEVCVATKLGCICIKQLE